MERKPLIIDTVREAYAASDVRTMTVRDLVELLEEFDEDRPVVLSFDGGYTYGGIRYQSFSDEEDK